MTRNEGRLGRLVSAGGENVAAAIMPADGAVAPVRDERPIWLSWLSAGPFTLEWPWWISGAALYSDNTTRDTICAAVMARNETHAKDIIRDAHDDHRAKIQWRFVRVDLPQAWSPFSERFPRADWMQWPVAESDRPGASMKAAETNSLPATPKGVSPRAGEEENA